MVAFATAYAFLFQWLGFVIATALMTVFVGRLFGGGWVKCAIGGLVMSAFFSSCSTRCWTWCCPVGCWRI